MPSIGAGHTSQGPTIGDIARDGRFLTVRCSPAAQVILLGNVGGATHLAGTALTAADLPLERFDGGWCRVAVRDARGRQAWSNPLWMDG